MALAAKRCGLGVFAVVLCLVAVCADHSIALLMRVAERAGLRRCKYPDLGKLLFGRKGEVAVAMSVILQQTGACIAYVVIIADTLVPILSLAATSEHSLFCQRWPWQILIVTFIIFPLCLFREMDKLRYTSFVALFFISSFTLAVAGIGIHAMSDHGFRDDLIARSISPDHGACKASSAAHIGEPGSRAYFGPRDGTILDALPIVCFAFLCHMNAFPIKNELKDQSLAAMNKVSKLSMLVCIAVYFTAGAFGYLTFLDSTADNLMLNFTTNGYTLAYVMDVLRVGFGIALIFSYPLIIYEAREGILGLALGHEHPSATVHFGLNVVMVATTCLLGILIPKIDTVFGVVGSTTSPTVVFILPAAFYLKQAYDAGDDIKTPRFIPSYILLTTGIVLIPVALYAWGALTFG